MRSQIPKREIDLLGRVPLFSGCSQRELREIARFGSEVMVGAGRVLIQEGTAGREFFLVLDGQAECTLGGKRKVLATFGPGQCFGELALLDGGLRTASVTATSDMRLLVLSGPEFSDVLRAAPSIAPKLLATLASRIRETQKVLSL